MKRAITGLIGLLLLSCAKLTSQFVQGPIRIALPVRQECHPDGSIVFATFNDGGTTMLKITDAEGHRHEVYFDHRFVGTNDNEFTRAAGTVYLNAYPGRTNSIRVIDQEEFKRTVLKDIVVP